MVLMNWKPSLSLAILGHLMAWNQQEKKEITVLVIKGETGFVLQ